MEGNYRKDSAINISIYISIEVTSFEPHSLEPVVVYGDLNIAYVTSWRNRIEFK